MLITHEYNFQLKLSIDQHNAQTVHACINGSTHYLRDKQDFDVSSEGLCLSSPR